LIGRDSSYPRIRSGGRDLAVEYTPAPWHTRTAHQPAGGDPAIAETSSVQLLPWEYLFKPFNQVPVPDLYNPLTIASLVWLIASIVVYNVRTRQLRRHPVHVQMYEWMLWTGAITASLMLVYRVFHFDMIIVLGTLFTGLGTMVWIRFRKFPPEVAVYERQLAKQRYFTRERFTRPEATIRAKSSRRRRRARR
jgi:hypothetical protein